MGKCLRRVKKKQGIDCRYNISHVKIHDSGSVLFVMGFCTVISFCYKVFSKFSKLNVFYLSSGTGTPVIALKKSTSSLKLQT